ncbi:MAG: hypothetical protein J6Z03_03305, partial [Erysipelotrichaceae bacterium]|nr:hypothetical protein [Erysipelotrichaceae bacterium]
MFFLFLYILVSPKGWVALWAITAFIYFFLLPKIGIRRWMAFIPFLAEKQLSGIYFKNRRFFFHALIISAIFLGAGFYLRYYGRGEMPALFGIGFFLLAIVIYRSFLTVLYWKIARSFHKNFFYCIFTAVFPFLFLLLLSRKKETFYNGPSYRISRLIIRPLRYAYYFVTETAFLGIAVALFLGVGYLTINIYMPRPMVLMNLVEKENQIANLHGDGVIIDRQASMGDEYLKLESAYAPVREKYFPDHSNDQSVVVLEYIIGSNLEDRAGLASFNIDQMKKATAAGSSLKFVIEAGGSRRWFTQGIKDKSLGRYEIADGRLTKVDDLTGTVSMSDPDHLYEFLKWAKDTYKADRYMLVFWDHGGGLSSGYGKDEINKRKENKVGTIMNNELIEAIGKSGMKFDLIGFDACLMQSVEIIKAMEPYADYFLASEESENGDGWFYTSAFELLAKDPTISTEDFGKEMISSYDVYNTLLNKGNVQKQTTLSLIDLSRINRAFDLLNDLYDKQDAAIKADSQDYQDIAVAASVAYKFGNDEQIDLIHYLQLLDDSDYDDTIVTSKQIADLINTVNSAIVYRNAVSNDGINGVAMTFPYDSISSYGDEHTQYKAFEMDNARNFYDDYFSIMAYQKSLKPQTVNIFGVQLDTSFDYTSEEWYVEGFENYVDVPEFIDIPLVEKDGVYELSLPDTVWKIIIDSREILYQKADEGWRYLGMDVPGMRDENDHPLVSTDGYWIHIGNQLICYEAKDSVDTSDGIIYTGTSRALLNDTAEIILNIEWEPINEDTGDEVYGKVTGYEFAADENGYMEKGTFELKPGDKISFLFDYYDEQGKLIKSETYGSPIRITSMSALRVEDRFIGECDLKYGVILKDVYQRLFETELLESHITTPAE